MAAPCTGCCSSVWSSEQGICFVCQIGTSWAVLAHTQSGQSGRCQVFSMFSFSRGLNGTGNQCKASRGGDWKWSPWERVIGQTCPYFLEVEKMCSREGRVCPHRRRVSVGTCQPSPVHAPGVFIFLPIWVSLERSPNAPHGDIQLPCVPW